MRSLSVLVAMTLMVFTGASLESSTEARGVAFWLGMEMFLARLELKIKEVYYPHDQQKQFFLHLDQEIAGEINSMNAVLMEQCTELSRPIFSSALCEKLIALRSSEPDILNKNIKDVIVKDLVDGLLKNLTARVEGPDTTQEMNDFIKDFFERLQEKSLTEVQDSLETMSGFANIKEVCLKGPTPTESSDDTCTSLLGVLRSGKWKRKAAAGDLSLAAAREELARDVLYSLVWDQDCGVEFKGRHFLRGDETEEIDQFFHELHDWLVDKTEAGLVHSRGTLPDDHGNNTINLLSFCLTVEDNVLFSRDCRPYTCHRIALAFGRFFKGIPLFPFADPVYKQAKLNSDREQSVSEEAPHPVLRSLILCIILLERIDAIEMASTQAFRPAVPTLHYPEETSSTNTHASAVPSITSTNELPSDLGGIVQITKLKQDIQDLEKEIAEMLTDIESGKENNMSEALLKALRQKGTLQIRLADLENQHASKTSGKDLNSKDEPKEENTCSIHAVQTNSDHGFSRANSASIQLHLRLDLGRVLYSEGDRAALVAQVQDDLAAALDCSPNRFVVRDLHYVAGISPSFKAKVEILSPNWVQTPVDGLDLANLISCSERSSLSVASSLKVMAQDPTSKLYFHGPTCMSWIGPHLASGDPITILDKHLKS